MFFFFYQIILSKSSLQISPFDLLKLYFTQLFNQSDYIETKGHLARLETLEVHSESGRVMGNTMGHLPDMHYKGVDALVS